jgi:isochorismate hydrolase
MSTTIKKNEKILSRDSSALLIIDIQEKILNVMHDKDLVVENTLKLIKGFKILNIPIFYTEQYPKGLGPTAASLLKELEGLSAIQKMTFSCYGAEGFISRL